MAVIYFKRYRMEIDLAAATIEQPSVPEYYDLIPWADAILPLHAQVKYRCFRHELDANVFPSLGDREGCRRLMHDISHRTGFLPQATWLLQYWPPPQRKPELCGTVQGVLDDSNGQGAIQNLGIVRSHRGHGLGSLLMSRALAGFVAAGLPRAYLEVTAQNVGAVRLYERLGFRRVKTVYKAAEVAYA